MSIQSELNRISNVKNDIANAIRSKGVEIPESAKFDEYNQYVDNIDLYDLSRSISIYDNKKKLISARYFADGNCYNAYRGYTIHIDENSLDNIFNACLDNMKIGVNISNMSYTYSGCTNLTGSPVCGNKVTTLVGTYEHCTNLTGSPVCGENVTSMYYTYSYCTNLTGNPVCGNNVTNMGYAYYNCSNLAGSPVCGENVTDMSYSYSYCTNLTGSPVCGNNVTSIVNAYRYCSKLTGNPVCGPNVVNMFCAYINCTNLTGSPICGNNVTSVGYAYTNCINLHSNGYFYSSNVSNVKNCFTGKNNSRRLNLYVLANSTTLNTCLYNNSYSLVGSTITWTQSGSNYYNTAYNIYIYPVSNVITIRSSNGD